MLKKTYQLPLVGEYPDDVFKTSLSENNKNLFKKMKIECRH